MSGDLDQMVDGEFVDDAPSPKPPKNTPEPPDIDLNSIRERNRTFAAQTPWQKAEAERQQLEGQIRGIPYYTADQVEEMDARDKAAYQSLQDKRRALEMRRDLLSERAQLEASNNELRQSVAENMWEWAEQEFGKAYAKKIIAMASGLPIEKQMRRETYEFIYDKMRGEELRKRDQQARLASATSTAGRSTGARMDMEDDSLTGQDLREIARIFGDDVADFARSEQKGRR